jgi:hypothetical protein
LNFFFFFFLQFKVSKHKWQCKNGKKQTFEFSPFTQWNHLQISKRRSVSSMLEYFFPCRVCHFWNSERQWLLKSMEIDCANKQNNTIESNVILNILRSQIYYLIPLQICLINLRSRQNFGLSSYWNSIDNVAPWGRFHLRIVEMVSVHKCMYACIDVPTFCAFFVCLLIDNFMSTLVPSISCFNSVRFSRAKRRATTAKMAFLDPISIEQSELLGHLILIPVFTSMVCSILVLLCNIYLRSWNSQNSRFVIMLMSATLFVSVNDSLAIYQKHLEMNGELCRFQVWLSGDCGWTPTNVNLLLTFRLQGWADTFSGLTVTSICVVIALKLFISMIRQGEISG